MNAARLTGTLLAAARLSVEALAKAERQARLNRPRVGGVTRV